MIPIRIKQSPVFIKQMLMRHVVSRRPEPANKVFHLCFFSCYSYFSYLYCSVHSLINLNTDVKFKFLIFNDEEQPLSEEQITIIKEMAPGCQVILWPKSMGWGEEQIACIWRAYKKTAQGLFENDYIVRVDSDVFFINDFIFQLVVKSNTDLVGDGHYVDFKYCQGGCYFFKVSAVEKITAQFYVEPMKKILGEIDVKVEDLAAHHFAERLGLKVWLTWFMMFPDEFKKGYGLTAWQQKKFSCVHFVMKNKDAMLVAYEKNMVRSDAVEEFRRLSKMK
jgi:hypothetical protein